MYLLVIPGTKKDYSCHFAIPHGDFFMYRLDSDVFDGQALPSFPWLGSLWTVGKTEISCDPRSMNPGCEIREIY